jgi:hypothetical protein
MAEKEKLFVEQCIKTALFFTETRSVVDTQRWFRAHLKRVGCLHSKKFINFITSLIVMFQCWRGNIANLHLCVPRRTLTLSEWRCKECPVYQQGRRQHNYGYPDDRCNGYCKVIWICSHTKWQCCLNLQFKTNIKEWHLLSGLPIMSGIALRSWTARAHFLWRVSEQWALFNHVVQYFCASPSCYRFAVTNSVVRAGWSQAAHSECCFRLSAWQFRLACHLNPISWSFCMWTELAPE